jgi:hypothetical protein
MLSILKWRLALLLTLRCEDRLELFFKGPGHGQAFDDHAVQSRDRIHGHSLFLGFGDKLRIVQILRKAGRRRFAERLLRDFYPILPSSGGRIKGTPKRSIPGSENLLIGYFFPVAVETL